MSVLYLYDFDGTITTKDSLFSFLKFATNKNKYSVILVRFIPLFILAKLGFLPKGETKRKFISACLKGKTKAELNSLASNFLSKIKHTSFFREKALKSIERHNTKGDVYIVTASVDLWMNDIANYLEVDLICTQADFSNGIFNGKFLTPNCNYEEKPKRVMAAIDIDSYTEIYYYGDSKGDLAMKSLATNFFFNHFK